MAAAGDVYAGVSSVANGASLTVQPAGSSDEAVIHNLYYEGAVEMYITDGTNSIKFDSDSNTFTSRQGMVVHVTHLQWLTVKNVSSATQKIAFDGVYTKP